MIKLSQWIKDDTRRYMYVKFSENLGVLVRVRMISLFRWLTSLFCKKPEYNDTHPLNLSKEFWERQEGYKGLLESAWTKNKFMPDAYRVEENGEKVHMKKECESLIVDLASQQIVDVIKELDDKGMLFSEEARIEEEMLKEKIRKGSKRK